MTARGRRLWRYIGATSVGALGWSLLLPAGDQEPRGALTIADVSEPGRPLFECVVANWAWGAMAVGAFIDEHGALWRYDRHGKMWSAKKATPSLGDDDPSGRPRLRRRRHGAER